MVSEELMFHAESSQQRDVNDIVEEETDKILQHLAASVPQELLEELDLRGGLKEKLYASFSQNYQRFSKRIFPDDAAAKKRYTHTEITELLDAMGGADRFNTGAIEKSLVNMYGHLQGHIQRGMSALEAQTNSLLRQKTDTGAFIRGENAYSVVKCAFTDNAAKPKTVTDVKLSINILDSELVSPIFHYQVTVGYLIKDLLSRHIIAAIDKEVENLRLERLDSGEEELSDTQTLFAKIAQVENYTDDRIDDIQSKRYALVARNILERVANLGTEIESEHFDQQSIRENVKKLIDLENIRSRGFNTAINSITAILDGQRLGYQFIENCKNGRELLIREYEDTDPASLPDEHYQIRLRYYDNAQLTEERKAYNLQMKSFEREIQHLWEVLDAIFVQGKPTLTRGSGFRGLAAQYAAKMIKKFRKDVPHEERSDSKEQVWDEFAFVKPEQTEVEQLHNTFVYEKETLRKKMARMRERIKALYDYHYPPERRVVENRLDFLEQEFCRFEYLINPYQLQSGLLLDVDITSIKRKKTTLDALSNVLNEFLHDVSKGFTDAAFASFSRRSPASVAFAQNQESLSPIDTQTSAEYLDLLNQGDPPACAQESGGVALDGDEQPIKEV
ncbi:cytochrome c oxidase subunit II [Spirochaetia bacterium]|nr:cytochrome c oxidase subunit II [Spirochaetia bacterium]